jgi:dienelactone hydrolase
MTARPSSSSVRARVRAALLFLALLALYRPAGAHLRAAGLLARFADPGAEGGWLDAVRHPVVESDATLGDARARVYTPADVERPPGVVLLHGVHWKGIDEPRLQRFARTLAASGVAVATPELRELCDYRIEPSAVETIGRSARAFATRLGVARVGLVGLSFSGGLSLVAASDPRFEDALSFVVAIGGHDDLGRVLRFFVTDEAARPDGSSLRVHAHDYGTVVLEYAHAEDFFAAEDLDAARDALRAVLHEDFDAARARARDLSPAGAAKMERILSHDVAALAPELLAEIDRLAPSLAAVSPSAHVSRLRVPAYVLHGAGDVLIPPSEAEWLARDVSPHALRAALVSRAIEHVDLEKDVTLGDRLALVHFMGDVLEAADRDR